MVKRSRAALLPTNLPHLQNLTKRDPLSYTEEFRQQWNHYLATLDVFLANPTENADSFAEVVGFIAQVATCFPVETSDFPHDLVRLLKTHHEMLLPELREKLVKSLVMLRNKGVIDSLTLLQSLFPLLIATHSKTLRQHLYATISSDIRTSNSKAKNHKLNGTIQSMLFNLLAEQIPSGVWATKLVREMWRRNIWNDSRTVEIMKEASLHSNTRIVVGGVRFFLGHDEEESDEEEDSIDVKRLIHQAGINKKNHGRDSKISKAIATREKKKNKGDLFNFSALHILNNPQGFAESLFTKHLSKSTKLSLEHRLLVLQLLSRLIGVHKLTILGVYSYLQKYLTPHQRDVTHFLACVAQASHEFIPPDVISPVIRKIADEFVTGGVASEVVCAGLNAIREICARSPLSLSEDMLQDLTEYKSSKDKGVMMASRSLIGLYRTVAPEMLKRRDRGKIVSMGMENSAANWRFGDERGVQRGIDGLELLETEGIEAEIDDEKGWEKWNVEKDASDSDGSSGWINVGSDNIDINISDSDDETQNAEGDQDTESNVKLTGTEGLHSIATTRILTPADFARLSELREKSAVDRQLGKPSKRLPELEFVDNTAIEGPRKKVRATYAERMQSVQEGREGREKFGSRKGNREENGRSTTNRQKALFPHS
ncbi:Protein sda1 [Neolecta irregularis DAH-3]|uniref:Protein SDA1 n=1 Tax=Neolecta irregularis (strain DAH-3) TaxID=1198029 RepID=A0A1U7LV95_NEOID|nr:Protein sda1 [Neolecta irregularis DAH-3]|eukprot:OLL26564.1 Protein sda1 [Neolecta irregularis DAH-3]